MGLLDAACSRSGFASGLSCKLLAGSLPTSGLASCLLGPSHGDGLNGLNRELEMEMEMDLL